MTTTVGNGFADNPEDMTLRQLRKLASKLGISRYSRMRKDQLLAEVKKRSSYDNPKASVTPDKTESITPVNSQEEETQVEAAKFEVGQDDPIELDLASVDEDLGDLPAAMVKVASFSYPVIPNGPTPTGISPTTTSNTCGTKGPADRPPPL